MRVRRDTRFAGAEREYRSALPLVPVGSAQSLSPALADIIGGRRVWTAAMISSRAQGARALAHPRVADDRAQARPALLPHAARARPRRLGTSHLTPRRSVPPSPPFADDSQSSGPLPQLSRLPPESGGPPKTERPESFPADRPTNHHVADPTVEHPDKPGRPRNDRNHTTPQPLAAAT
jgi:hypothetical protein